MYSLLKKILFCFDPERAHHLTLEALQLAEKLGFSRLIKPDYSHPMKVMSLDFPHPIGLAAGLDKNGDYIDALAMLGFGFIEVGSITLKPQPGNPKPRLIRLEKESAIINRMGFNNKGVDYMIERLKNTKYRGILGINIGKNKDTPLDNAVEEYVTVQRQVQPYASYVTINISSPNTEKLRDLQHGDMLKILLNALKQEQATFFAATKKYVPLVVKISPDLSQDELRDMANIFLDTKIDGIIATNTTLNRFDLNIQESGGLSGKPLTHLSTDVIKKLNQLLQGRIPIIGCGGIMTANDGKEKLAVGASLLQIYTGLIYQGPGLVKALATSLK